MHQVIEAKVPNFNSWPEESEEEKLGDKGSCTIDKGLTILYWYYNRVELKQFEMRIF